MYLIGNNDSQLYKMDVYTDKTRGFQYQVVFNCIDMRGVMVASGEGSGQYLDNYLKRFIIVPDEIAHRLHVGINS